MEDEKVTRKDAIPGWAAAPFHEFLNHHEETTRLLHLTMKGIAMVRGAPRALEVLADIEGELDTEETKRRLEIARSEAALAESEVSRGFPVLHAQNLVSLWGSLEALVKSVVASWFLNDPSSYAASQIEKLKVKLGDFMTLNPLEQCEYVVELLDQQEGGAQRHGVNRFESLLAPIGLAGPVGEQVCKAIYELEQLRHVLVHRRGVADRKLTEACPWLEVKPGDRLTITHDSFGRLSDACQSYVLELIQRARERFGIVRFDVENWRGRQILSDAADDTSNDAAPAGG